MPGGACEATAFSAYGYESTCLCLPLGNYHNMHDIDVVAGRRKHEGEDLLLLTLGQVFRLGCELEDDAQGDQDHRGDENQAPHHAREQPAVLPAVGLLRTPRSQDQQAERRSVRLTASAI